MQFSIVAWILCIKTTLRQNLGWFKKFYWLFYFFAITQISKSLKGSNTKTQIEFVLLIILSFCFLNDWLSKGLNWSQKSIVKFRHFLCSYIIYIEKKVVCRKCMYVCLCVSMCVCVCKLSIFCRAITRKTLHRSLWNFA